MAFVLHRRRTTNRRTAIIVTAGVALAIGGSAVLGSATALAAGAQVARHSQAAVTSLPCDSQFHVVPTAIAPAFESSVFGMAAVSANDVWAVGITTPTHYWYGTLAAHWDGSSWTEVASPYPASPNNPNSALWAVTLVPGAIASNVWAVGSTGGAALAAQWNGNGWNLFAPPGMSGGNVLKGVVAISPNDIWAVGYGSHVGASITRTVIDHYDGVSWSSVSSPDPSTTSSDELLSVSAASATDIWAVGDSIVGTTHRTLVEHWDGTKWSIVASPNVGPSNNTLNAVGSLSTSNAWAVGTWTDSADRTETLTQRWDGTSWTVVQSPTIDAGNVDNDLQSLVAISPDNIWAAGVISQQKTIIFHPIFTSPLVEHWDGQGWSVVPSPDGLPPIPHNYGDTTFPSEFHAITATSSSNVWAAGQYDDVTQPTPNEYPLFENLCIPIPIVSSVVPLSGNATGGPASPSRVGTSTT